MQKVIFLLYFWTLLKSKFKGLKKQKKYYSGKKKRHTIKVQLTVNADNLDICSVNFGKGSEHDFYLFQNSRLKIHERIQIIADKGYQGIKTEHQNSLIPLKKSKYYNLTELQKAYNQTISKNRTRKLLLKKIQNIISEGQK